MEIWKDVVYFEGLYQVSNLGRVKSLNYSRTGREKVLKPSKTNGYLQVYLYKEGKSKRFSIHRLVAFAFIPNPNNLPIVNHKDEDKSNNCVDNLEWCTVAYNNNYGTKNQRQAESLKGFKHSEETRKKLSEARKGKHHTEETKKKMSEAQKGKPKSEETKKKLSEANKGKHHSEEAKKKMSESRKGKDNHRIGKHHSEETKAKMSESRKKKVYCLETNKTYPSVKQCAEELGLNKSSISNVCNGKQKQTKGYHFYYTENIIFMN